MIRILLIDDHAILRAGIRMLLENEPGMHIVGEAGSRAEALALVAHKRADIILLDMDLGQGCDPNLLHELRPLAAGAKVIILTGVRDPEMHQRFVALGATGLVHKEQATEVLVKAIEKVHAGEAWLDHSTTARMIADIWSRDKAAKEDPEAARMALLTARERQVVELVAQGLRRKQIAERLFISEPTVRNHLSSIFEKLGISDRFELALLAYRHGLANPPEKPH